jgi:hypothetical protein
LDNIQNKNKKIGAKQYTAWFGIKAIIETIDEKTDE